MKLLFLSLREAPSKQSEESFLASQFNITPGSFKYNHVYKLCPLCLHYASVRHSYCITSSPSLTEPDGGTAEQNAAYTAEEDNAAASEFRQVSVSYYL